MKRYIVQARRTDYYYVPVQAETEQQARAEAEKLLDACDVPYNRYGFTTDGFEIENVEKE